MARRRKKKTSHRRRSRKSAPKRRRRRGGRGGGGVFTSFMGRPIYKPTKDVAWYAGAMMAGEVVLDIIEAKTGFEVPDWVPDQAAGLFAYGWWFKDRDAQLFAQALTLSDFVDDMDWVADAKATVRGFAGADDDDVEVDEDEDEEEEDEENIADQLDELLQ